MMPYLNLGIMVFGLLMTIVIYNIIPKKIRPLLLLLVSFGFFFILSNWLIVFLLLSILSVYIITNWLDDLNKERDKLISENSDIKKEIKEKYRKKKKLVLLLGIIFNVSFLFMFKYVNFFGTNLSNLLGLFNVDFNYRVVKIIAPIGISFYTLEALGYIFDVYYEKIEADKNILRVALFLSFFPQLMEGPIARYSDTAKDLYRGAKVTYHNFCFGLQRIGYGVFKRIIIADRLSHLVSIVFKHYSSYSGSTILLGIIGYTVLLYMDFSGTIDIFIGIGEIFGIKIPENFRQPFFAKNISEFWTRWHISLGLWFKDYIFYPISLSKKMKKLTIKARKVLGNHFGPLISGAIALFAVWSLNGLWHGAGWPFLFYGMYQFTLILMGNIFEPLIIKICKLLHINRENIIYRIIQSVKMTLFVFIGELFFRAPTVSIGFKMLKKVFTNFNLTTTLKNGEFLNLGLDLYDFLVIIGALVVIFVISLLKEKNHNIREEINKKHIVLRWGILYALLFAIVIFGAYGPGYQPAEPIYADF